MEQIASALSEASLRKGETERLKEDLAVNEKATQGRKGDIEQVGGTISMRHGRLFRWKGSALGGFVSRNRTSAICRCWGGASSSHGKL